MNIYYAPLEGITGYILRRTHMRHFGHIDQYFIPFIQPKQHGHFSNREKQDILPEHNEGLRAIPQLLTNNAHDFLQTTEKLAALGYNSVNLNLGCPARTVVSKGRGSGQLADLLALDAFLKEIFTHSALPISIKTRIGIEDPSEFEVLQTIYEQYPLQELIIHPRVQKEFYNGTPHREVVQGLFSGARPREAFPICYNGDIVSKNDYEGLRGDIPLLHSVMLGRGLLKRPALAREIAGGEPATKEELKAYHDDLYQQYQQVLSGNRVMLFKMKEFWVYQIQAFADHKKLEKKIKKAQRLTVYEQLVEEVFATLALLP